MGPRHLLVVNYEYPPVASVGGVRWLTMKKYLERLGYRVSVLTTDAFGRLADDEAQGVIRAPDLVGSQTLRRVLRRPELPSLGSDPVDTTPSWLVTSVVVPAPAG